MIVNLKIAAEALSEAMSGRTCSSAWLGYGNVLFLSFGKISFVDVPLSRGTIKHCIAEYKVRTNFADWSVETAGTPASRIEMDMDQAEQAVKLLEGKQVLRWQLIEGHGLQIEFEGGLRLRVVPWTDSNCADSDAWCVSLPDNRVVAMSCDGRVAAVDRGVPIRDWFRNSK